MPTIVHPSAARVSDACSLPIGAPFRKTVKAAPAVNGGAGATTSWAAASDPIASANLQSRIEELAASAGVTIGSAEGLAVENRGGYRRIGLRFVISGQYEPIVKLLSAIETTVPPLVLSNLQLRGSNLQLHGAARPAEASIARLDAGFEIYGFRSTDPSPVSKQ